MGRKRPIAANQANVPTVKIGSYSKRDPKCLFYPQGKNPRPVDTQGHGGVFYDVMKNHAKIAYSTKLSNVVPFDRKNIMSKRKEEIKCMVPTTLYFR